MKKNNRKEIIQLYFSKEKYINLSIIIDEEEEIQINDLKDAIEALACYLFEEKYSITTSAPRKKLTDYVRQFHNEPIFLFDKKQNDLTYLKAHEFQEILQKDTEIKRIEAADFEILEKIAQETRDSQERISALRLKLGLYKEAEQ